MEASSNPTNSRGVSRILAKFQSNLDNHNFYEAHQLCKTLSHRFASQKKYNEAISALHNGACKLLQRGQCQSGSDLSMMLLDILNKLDSESKTAHIEKISELHSLIPPDTPERQLFVCKAVSATRSTAQTAGSPQLHRVLAHNLWREKRHAQALYHFLYASDGENCGKFLVEFQQDFGGHPVEVDLFITQTVLQLLCLKNTPTANLTFTTYVTEHPDVTVGPPYLLPLLNFLSFLLLAVQDGKLTVFTVLCEKYQPSLNRDPSYKQYLDRIGQNFFGVPAPSQGDGFLGGIMRSIFAGLSEDSDEEYEEAIPDTPASSYTPSDLD